MKKKVAIIQPSYIPWKGYFDIIHDVDEFVFLDSVQYTSRDWRSRNRIKSPNGLLWLSVPVGANRNRLIRDVSIPDPSWQADHWKTMVHAYGKTCGFRLYRSVFEQLYLGQRWQNLSEMNKAITRTIAHDILRLSTKFTDASDYMPEGAKLDLILDILKRAGATHYLTGPTAADYVDQARFDELGIQLSYKDYSGYPEYPQKYPPFEHSVSIVDLLFNVGEGPERYIWGAMS